MQHASKHNCTSGGKYLNEYVNNKYVKVKKVTLIEKKSKIVNYIFVLKLF